MPPYLSFMMSVSGYFLINSQYTSISCLVLVEHAKMWRGVIPNRTLPVAFIRCPGNFDVKGFASHLRSLNTLSPYHDMIGSSLLPVLCINYVMDYGKCDLLVYLTCSLFYIPQRQAQSSFLSTYINVGAGVVALILCPFQPHFGGKLRFLLQGDDCWSSQES